MGNINKNELKYFKNAAKDYFILTDERIAIHLQKNTLKEIISEAEE